jgi:biotin carboxyl carrier protein
MTLSSKGSNLQGTAATNRVLGKYLVERSNILKGVALVSVICAVSLIYIISRNFNSNAAAIQDRPSIVPSSSPIKSPIVEKTESEGNSNFNPQNPKNSPELSAPMVPQEPLMSPNESQVEGNLKNNIGTETPLQNPNSIAVTFPGMLVQINVVPGQVVTKNQVLFVIEVMKMQISVPSPRDGTIKKIDGQCGTFVEVGKVLIFFE